MKSTDTGKYPAAPGVYLMKGPAGEVLYVGKAKNLRQRLRSYQNIKRDSRPQIRFLLGQAKRIETIVTDTEKEALILENVLIKKHRPRYNIHLRDDKTFVSLRLDLKEDFPALEIVRRVRQDGARYFGPYASASAVRETLKQIYRIFPLRHYPIATCRRRGRPCLFYQIGQCSAPCHGMITAQEYRGLVDGVVALLTGRQREILDKLAQQMLSASVAMRYEDAARYRDQIQAIEQTLEHQKTVRHGGRDIDVVGIYREGGECEVSLLLIRQGELSGRRNYNLDWVHDERELLEQFLNQYYGRDVPIPDDILLPINIEGTNALSEWLTERHDRKVRVQVPKRGERLHLVSLAVRNAKEAWRERGSRGEARSEVLKEIERRLGLQKLPHRMECFDISTIQGNWTVGSMAVVIDGEPKRSEYRHFRIKTVSGMDDFAALREILQRRLKRAIAESQFPDFILVDGGKGQLGVASAMLEDLGLKDRIDIAGIAKSRVIARSGGGRIERSEERIFLPGRVNPVVLRAGSAAMFMLERLRDEAHRFALAYHRKLRSKSQTESLLNDIPGIGPGRRKTLLRHFGSLGEIAKAELSELKKVPGIPEKVASQVFQFFHPKA